MAIRTAIKKILGKAKSIGSSILRKLKPMDIDVRSATKGLNELKSKEGFNKLTPEHQRKLIENYIKKIPFKGR